jgi:hypothetical protein
VIVFPKSSSQSRFQVVHLPVVPEVDTVASTRSAIQ